MHRLLKPCSTAWQGGRADPWRARACISRGGPLAAQLECVRFLVEQRGARVNQRDAARGWTPLHRCANVAHHTHAPFLAVFEYLLQRGADAALLTEPSARPDQAGRATRLPPAACKRRAPSGALMCSPAMPC